MSTHLGSASYGATTTEYLLDSLGSNPFSQPRRTSSSTTFCLRGLNHRIHPEALAPNRAKNLVASAVGDAVSAPAGAAAASASAGAGAGAGVCLAM